MAVLTTLEVTGGTTAQYDRANELLGIAHEHDAPAGLVAQACAVTDDGIVVVGVWDSEGSLEAFARERLEAARREAGLPDGSLHIATAHELLFGVGKEANVLVLVHALGLTVAAYERVVANMPSHAGGGASHPAVMHVAAAEQDGFRIAALWESEAAYLEFARSELLPAVGDPRQFVLRVWPVHAWLRAEPPAAS